MYGNRIPIKEKRPLNGPAHPGDGGLPTGPMMNFGHHCLCSFIVYSGGARQHCRLCSHYHPLEVSLKPRLEISELVV